MVMYLLLYFIVTLISMDDWNHFSENVRGGLDCTEERDLATYYDEAMTLNSVIGRIPSR